MFDGRGNHTATVLGTSKVLLVGGFDTTTFSSFAVKEAELYDFGTGMFSPTGALGSARFNHTATSLGSGRILVVGGYTYSPTSALASAEIYDPVIGTFAPTNSALTTAREGHTASILPSGAVLIAGGYFATELSSAELFDPVTETFFPSTPMGAARTEHTATELASGDVLVAGGGIPALSSAERFVLQATGATCTVDAECALGICTDGVCCTSKCTGECETCSPGTGACAAVVGTEDADSCTGTKTCDAAGACAQKNGQPCVTANECISGYCVDGVCCNSVCGSQCEACDASGSVGYCKTIVGSPHGARPPCDGGEGLCATTCGGNDPTQCAFPGTETSCTPISCTTGVSQPAGHCDGSGSCSIPAPQECSPYACNEANSLCRSSCASKDDCAPGHECKASECVTLAPDSGVGGAGGSGTAPGDASTMATNAADDAGCGCRIARPRRRGVQLAALGALALLCVRRRRPRGRTERRRPGLRRQLPMLTHHPERRTIGKAT